MDKLKRIRKIINWIVFAYLIGIIILTWIGKLTYGHGLGDLIFFFMSVAFAIIHLLPAMFNFPKLFSYET